MEYVNGKKRNKLFKSDNKWPKIVDDSSRILFRFVGKILIDLFKILF